MEEKKIVFALDIGTRSVVGVVGALKDGKFNVLDYEQEFHEKRAMRDGQIEDIDLVARIVGNVKAKLEQRTGQAFKKVSIAAAGRALRTAPASFSYDLIESDPISEKLVQYMEYCAIEKAQQTFLEEAANLEAGGKNYYCVGYSVTEYLLDNYPIKNLEGHKGSKAVTNIIAAFLPSSVLISLYAVTSRCGLEVDNLTLEPIAAIHAVVPDDVRFLNIALVDIGGGTSDIAVSRDGSVIAYDMVTTAGDEITESIMRTYLTNFATAERIKLGLNGDENIGFRDILGNQVTLTPDEAYETVKPSIDALCDAISQRIILINGSAPAAVFLVGGGSQLRGLCKTVAEKLGMPPNRVAIGIANTENNLSLFSESLYSPTFVTPIGIGIVSSLYRGCDFFSITVNGKRIMLFNHQTIKVIDALMLAGIKPSGLIGLTAPNLVYVINGVKETVKGTLGVPGEILVNGSPSTIEAEIKQGDIIEVTMAKNGLPPVMTIAQALSELDLQEVAQVSVNGVEIEPNQYTARKINYMDHIKVFMTWEMPQEVLPAGQPVQAAERNAEPVQEIDSLAATVSSLISEPVSVPTIELNNLSPNIHYENVEMDKIYSHAIQQSTVSLLLADSETSTIIEASEPATNFERLEVEEKQSDSPAPLVLRIKLNGEAQELIQEGDEPYILMYLLRYIEIDLANPRGEIVLKINGRDANYADPLNDGDSVIICWSDDLIGL
ncbi:cell division protein FtsA [Clostridium aminobutyricum]|uniref:Rod shape-determining protein n=1 Tax=Clostridium aminobutyricum TaxID=33953 RepID=A0A939D9P4_CLOAM|nr:cell division FtsA domain-containing protein [Clostridium aminobutyricum]MBN7773736.1 rod shape-determining protein [Clostridium aminobutyricum]